MAKNKDRIVRWHGVDVDKEISLFEYGLLVRWDQMNKKHQVIYKIDKNKWGITTMSDSDVNEKPLESWFESDKFFEFIGMTPKEWLECNFVTKLSDLLKYEGYQNIIGTTDYPRSAKEVCKLARIQFTPEYMYM